MKTCHHYITDDAKLRCCQRRADHRGDHRVDIGDRTVRWTTDERGTVLGKVIKPRTPMECLVCGVGLESAGTQVQPSRGTLWESSGNYGSAVLDRNGAVLAFVCDNCLLEREDRLVSFRNVEREAVCYLPGLVLKNEEEWVDAVKDAVRTIHKETRWADE